MSTAAASPAASTKLVDASLWWDSFVLLFEELDAAPLSDDIPDPLVEKIKRNHAWFLDTVSRFKPPDRESRSALDSPEISVGSHRLVVKPDLKEAALRASACLCLNEVQSYILVNRTFELKKSVAAVEGQEFLQLILLEYYVERQCLLKCVRCMFAHALYKSNGSSNDAIRVEALQLVDDGLDGKLLSVVQDLFSSVPLESTALNNQYFKMRDADAVRHPYHHAVAAASETTFSVCGQISLEVEFMVLWVEESLIEDSLVLDILFLYYYDNFCNCSLEQWKTLCLLFKGILSGTFNVGKLAVSVESRNLFALTKAQLLFILIETLDLENLLRMVHDEVPLRQGSKFSLSEVQEIDALVSGFSDLGIIEAEPLILAWAVFICLLLSLPDGRQYSILTEIDHVGYVRQAFEAAPLNYLLEVLRSDTLRDSYGPVSGFFCILRTFVSAFIASYDLTQQSDDNILNEILDIICETYQGEESLSMQFWDRDSIVDGPIRSLLYVLEREYPFQTVKFVRLLSALCGGTWAAECVYNFLDNMSGITMPFMVPGGSYHVNIYDVIETCKPLQIPGVEGLIVPCRTRGHCLKIIDEKVILVRWEFAHSGIFLLLLRLAQEPHPDSYEEVLITLKLLYRMVSCSAALCFSLLYIDKSLSIEAAQKSGHIEKNMRVDVAKIVCSLVCYFVQDVSNTGAVSICINIMAEMLACSPSLVIEAALWSNFFRIDINSSSSGTWLLSGGLARMLLADSGENAECFPLTTSVLDFTVNLVELGAEDDLISALVVYSLQFVLVNHLNWNYKLKHSRWKVTLKVLDVMKSCVKAIRVSHRLGIMFRDILLSDSSIHTVIFRIICMSTQAWERSYVTSHSEIKEIEGLHQAVRSALDIIYSLLATLSKETFSSTPSFVQNMLSSASKGIPFVSAIISMISFFHYPALQVSAAKVLSLLCCTASRVQPYSVENIGLVVDSIQVKNLNIAINAILKEEQNRNEDLLGAVFDLLISAARYQPALLVCLLPVEEEVEIPLDSAASKNKQIVASAPHPLKCSKPTSIESILEYLRKSDVLIKSAPHLLLGVLVLLKSIWEGGIQYIWILEKIRSTDMFWKQLLSVFVTEAGTAISFKDVKSDQTECTGYRFHCQGTVLDIMAHELFLQEKLLQNDMSENLTSAGLTGKTENRSHTQISKASNTDHLKVILSTWCESSTLDNLIKAYSSGGYDSDIILNAKIVVCLCVVHLVSKLSTGDAGSLSISLVEKIRTVSNKLSEHPAFSALLAQYSSRGYSEGKELTSLVLSDLYYQLQGQLEGREVAPGHFQELCRFLLDLENFQCNESRYERDIWSRENVHMFRIPCLKAEFRVEHWDYSDWKASKEIAERMFLHMHYANLVMFLTYSQHFALKSLTSIINLCEGNIPKSKLLVGNVMSEPLIESSIKYLCKRLRALEDLIAPALNPSMELLQLVTAHVELLLVLSRIIFRKHSHRTNGRFIFPLSALLIRVSGLGIKSMVDIRPLNTVLTSALKLHLLLLLTSIEFFHPMASVVEKSDLETKLFAEVSLISTGLLPILCTFVENNEFSDLSVASLDLILRGFVAPNTWLPILRKHLQLQFAVQKFQQKDSEVPISGILNFFLTLANVKGGAELLHSVNIVTFLKFLFTHLMNDDTYYSKFDGHVIPPFTKDDSYAYHWGLGLAIITAVVNSLADDYSCTDIVDSAICYFFSEKAYIVSSYLSAPVFVDDDHDKKRARNPKAQTSLTALKVTEQTLMLMCVLARHQASWSKGMKEIDSNIREMTIHLLAFISRGIQRIGESPNKLLHPFCPPILKDEVDLNREPSFVNCKHGWFMLSSFGIVTKTKVSATGLSLVINNQLNENSDLVRQSRFSDNVAIQIYRIAFLVLKFLCMHAKVAAKRAEEVEFIDLTHFPELPMPEILHGLQDQVIAIITEVCEDKRSKPIQPEIEGLCLLLLQILEKSLYLELCVSKSCGIRPVFGRMEDFCTEFKLLVQVISQHSNLKASLRSLAPVIGLVYPGLLQISSLF